jgi:hypothetical protein
VGGLGESNGGVLKTSATFQKAEEEAIETPALALEQNDERAGDVTLG